MDRVSVGPVKGLKIAIAAFILSLVLLFMVAGATALVLTDHASEAAETHEALCAFKGDLEKRVELGEAFITEHPEGAFGVSAATLQTSLNYQRSTIEALAGVDCP